MRLLLSEATSPLLEFCSSLRYMPRPVYVSICFVWKAKTNPLLFSIQNPLIDAIAECSYIADTRPANWHIAIQDILNNRFHRLRVSRLCDDA